MLRRVQSELGHLLTMALESSEGIGLASGAIQRDRQLFPDAIPEREGDRGRLGLGDDRCRLARFELGRQQLLGCLAPQLVEPTGLGLHR